MKRSRLVFGALAGVCCAFAAKAADIGTNMAEMQAMDKITGRVSTIKVPVNGEVKFGSFSIVVRECKTRSAEEIPENFAFVDVADTGFDGKQANIFKGWMISSSPALNAVEHPIYDVWLTKCVDGEVKKAALLSSEELSLRDVLPKAEVEDAPILPEIKMPKEMAAEAPEADTFAAPVMEEVIVEDEAASSELRVIEVPSFGLADPSEPVEGGPQSLLNFGTEAFDEAPAKPSEGEGPIKEGESGTPSGSSFLDLDASSLTEEDKPNQDMFRFDSREE